MRILCALPGASYAFAPGHYLIPAAQIEDDLTRLSAVTDCILELLSRFRPRSDSGDSGHNIFKVMQGLWLSSNPEKSHYEIEMVSCSPRVPATSGRLSLVTRALPRATRPATDLTNTIRAIKARVQVPVTYVPSGNSGCATGRSKRRRFHNNSHPPLLGGFPDCRQRFCWRMPNSICRQVVAAFPGKEVLIG